LPAAAPRRVAIAILGTGFRLFYPEMTEEGDIVARARPLYSAGADGIHSTTTA